MNLFVFYISSSFILFSIIVPGYVEGLHSPLAVSIEVDELMVVNIQTYINEDGTLMKDIILSCPPESNAEVNIIANSNTANGLIVKQFLKKGTVYEKGSSNDICEKEITPSIISNEMYKYSVGYEIIDAHKLIDENLEKMYKPKDFQGKFQWVETYDVGKKQKNYQTVMYTIHALNDEFISNPPDLCKEIETMENQTLDTFISFVNEKINSPAKKLKPTNENVGEISGKKNEILGEEIPSVTNRPLIQKVYLAEPEDFDDYYSKLSTCFEINISAMWEPVVNGAWKKVGNFIRNVNMKLSNKGVIAMYKAADGAIKDPTSAEPKSLFWAPAASFPSRFWNFIVFSGDDNNSLGIFIVIHNNINERMEKLCKEDVCQKYGWEVGSDDFRTGETYCCEPMTMNSERIKKGIHEKYEPFDLNRFL